MNFEYNFYNKKMSYSVIRVYIEPIPGKHHTVDLPPSWRKDDDFAIMPEEKKIMQRFSIREVYRGPIQDENDAQYMIFKSLKYACMNLELIKEWSLNKPLRSNYG